MTGLPNPGHGGASLTAWSLVEALLEAGHDVTSIALRGLEPDPHETRRVDALEAIGVKVVSIDSPPAPPPPTGRVGLLVGLLSPRDETLFPGVIAAPAVERAIAGVDAEVALAYTNDAVAAVHRLRSVPTAALVSDPPHLSHWLRLRHEPAVRWRPGKLPLLYRVGELARILKSRRRMVAMLRRFPTVGFFGAHHADWGRRNRIAAWYAPSPIVDAAGPGWASRRAAEQPRDRPRILMIGHLRGIGTITGLELFVRDILPALTAELGEDGFEVHVVGGYEPPARLRAALEHPAVRLRGHVEPADDEFLRADVVLVPTPIRTGPRTRILTAFSFGCCVVAHRANALGIPELAHGGNALLGADGRQLAAELLQAIADPSLRERLGLAGRTLYEDRFSSAVAGERIVAELERLQASRVTVG